MNYVQEQSIPQKKLPDTQSARKNGPKKLYEVLIKFS